MQSDTFNISHYLTMAIGLFARMNNLTRTEACNYLHRYKGLRFAIDNYEAEHQLSLAECCDDMMAICRKNGGLI